MASFLGELRRRNVFKVAVAYAIVAWLVIQIAATVFPILQIPDWATAFVTVLLLLGFPVAIVLSWAYELTPDGVARTKSIAADQSITRTTGQKLNFAIIALLVPALGFLAASHYVLEGDGPSIAHDRRSIAVLPLMTQSAGEENAEFFATGFHDQLLTQLAKIGSLKVISRTSVMEYAGQPGNVREIGRQLGVATILEGSVQQAGDMIAMNVQLIDAETDGHLWAETYNRELTVENIFALQREMATAIAAALQAAILPEEADRLDEIPTRSRIAFEHYLRGNEYRRNPDDTTYGPMAVAEYQAAVDADPGFALAWARLGQAHSNVFLYATDRSEARLEMADAAIDRAFELSPGLPEAHLARGQYFYHGFRDYERTLEHYAIAEDGLSGTSELYEVLGFVYRRMGRFEDSIAALDRAIELDPRNLGLIFQQGFTHALLRRYADAEEYLDRVLEIDPSNPQAYSMQVEIPKWRDGDPGPARAAAAGARDVDARSELGYFAAMFDADYAAAIGYLDAGDVGDSGFVISQVQYFPVAALYAAAHLGAGRVEQAAEQFALANEQLTPVLQANPEDARIRAAHAMILAGLGEHESALREARLALDLLPVSVDAIGASGIHDQTIFNVFAPIGDVDVLTAELDTLLSNPAGVWSIEGLMRHPAITPYVADPRFQALVEKYGRGE